MHFCNNKRFSYFFTLAIHKLLFLLRYFHKLLFHASDCYECKVRQHKCAMNFIFNVWGLGNAFPLVANHVLAQFSRGIATIC